MASDKLFNKMKARKASDLKRKNASRKAMEKILIVCEGEKTEPEYFDEIIAHYKLTSTDSVFITGDCGSSPKSVVEHAREVDRKESKKSSPYDLVYCVFDKDSHADYNTAIEQVRQLKPAGKFHVINSVPCFEYWFFLHFTNSRKSFVGDKKNSAGMQMQKELKSHIHDYQKNKKGMFALLHDKLQDAINNSIKVRKLAEQDGNENPSTKVDILVEKLIEVKKGFYGS